MYKLILLNDEQTNLNRVVYRFSTSEPIRDFRLKTVTFGTANAPYLAIRTLQELAEIHANSHPLASETIMSSMYMDVVIGGCHSLNNVTRMYEEMKTVFLSARFNLQKWCSNSKELLKIIPEVDRAGKDFDACVKTLGVSWRAENDMFTCTFGTVVDTWPKTKRQLTSEIATLFDPFGWIAPVMIIAKSIIQKLWKAKLDWDETVDSKHIALWEKIKGELPLLSEFGIPRWVNFDPDDEMEIHGFSNPSEIGFAAGQCRWPPLI